MGIKELVLVRIKNNKELFWNILGSFGVKGLAMVVTIFTLPAYMYYFQNAKVLGVWFAMLSILNWILTFDLGVGNGLRNYLVEALVDKNNEKAKKYISSGYIIIGLFTIVLMLIGNICIRFIDWNIFLNVTTEVISKSVLLNVVALIFSGILIQLFLKLILSILYALQHTAASNFTLLIANSMILLFVVSFRFDQTGLALRYLSVAYVVLINLPLLIATCYVFAKPLKNANFTLWN